MVFGLGDSSYYFFCKAAKDVEAKLEELGAEKMLSMGMGDDSAEEGMEQGLHDWLDKVWPALEVPPPKEVPHIEPIKVQFSERAVLSTEDDKHAIDQFFGSDDIHAKSVPIITNDLMCRPDYRYVSRTLSLM